MKTYTIAKRGKGKTRTAVIMRKGGKIVAQFCQSFLPNLWTLQRGETSIAVVVSAESIDPEQEWKITVHPWNGAAERVSIEQCADPGPHGIWPSLAVLLRDVVDNASDKESTIVYVILERDAGVSHRAQNTTNPIP